jgi:hypothetical protein
LCIDTIRYLTVLAHQWTLGSVQTLVHGSMYGLIHALMDRYVD